MQLYHIYNILSISKTEKDTALLPIISRHQLSPPANEMFIYQLRSHICKPLVVDLFTVETVIPYLQDLERIVCQVMYTSILPRGNWYQVIISIKAVQQLTGNFDPAW